MDPVSVGSHTGMCSVPPLVCRYGVQSEYRMGGSLFSLCGNNHRTGDLLHSDLKDQAELVGIGLCLELGSVDLGAGPIKSVPRGYAMAYAPVSYGFVLLAPLSGGWSILDDEQDLDRSDDDKDGCGRREMTHA